MKPALLGAPPPTLQQCMSVRYRTNASSNESFSTARASTQPPVFSLAVPSFILTLEHCMHIFSEKLLGISVDQQGYGKIASLFSRHYWV